MVVRIQAGTEGVDDVVGPEVTVTWAVGDSVVVTDTAAVAGVGGATLTQASEPEA